MADSRRHFVILSTARSGSTWLMELLNNHSDLGCQLQPLSQKVLLERKLEDATNDDLLKHIEETVGKESKHVVGLKIFLEHLSDNGLTMGEVLSLLNNPKVIVLYRPNLLETYVSLQIARRTNTWYSTTGVNNVSVEINREAFLRHAGERREMWKSAMTQVDEFVRPCDKIIVSYDELCQDRYGVVQNIFSFLGVRRLLRKLESYCVKQNPGRLKDKIKNYDNISDLIMDGGEHVTLSL